MFGALYQQIVPVTTDYSVAEGDSLLVVPLAETSINTITLRLARLADEVFIQNLSLVPQIIAVQSGDTLNARSILAPGALVHLRSDSLTGWYAFGDGAAGSQSVNVAVSSANFLALNGTPLPLIKAPGVGRVALVSSILFQMTRTGTAYANGGALEFRYTNGSGAKVSADIAAAVVTTGGAGVEYSHVAGIEAAITPVANAAIVLVAASADFITGTGTGKLSIGYRIADFN